MHPRLLSVLVAACGLLLSATAHVAAQTGPPTLENLLGPEAEAKPFDPPRPPAARQDKDEPRPASPAPPPPPPAQRMPVPAPESVAEALTVIRQAYEETLASAAAKPEAAIRTFRDAADKTEDPSRKFALLDLAEQVAIDAGSISGALDVVARRARLFVIDELNARHALLSRVARAPQARPDALVFEKVMATVDMAVAADQFDLADAAADLSLEIAKEIAKEERARSAERRKKGEKPPAPVTPVGPGLIAEATEQQKTVRERRRQAFEYAAARDALTAAPDDAGAAEIVGRYLCFVRRDWKKGLVSLALGRDESLRSLAAAEVALMADPKAAAQARLKLANDWWKLADAGSGVTAAEATAVKAHAGDIYREVAPKLTDPVDVALAKKRARETGSEPPAADADAEPAKKPSAPLPTLDAVLEGRDT